MQEKDKDSIVITKLRKDLIDYGISLDSNLLTILNKKNGKSNYRIGMWGQFVCADWKADGVYKKLWHIISNKNLALERIGNSIIKKLNDYELEKQYKIAGVTDDDPIVRTQWAYDPIHYGWSEVDRTRTIPVYRTCFLQEPLHPECDRHCAVKADCKNDEENDIDEDRMKVHFFNGNNLDTIKTMNNRQIPIPIEEKETISEVRIIHSGEDMEEYFK